MSNVREEVGESELHERLKQALPHELEGLVDVLTDGGKGRVSVGSAVRHLFVKAKELGTFTDGTRELLVTEVLAFGGSALANLKRGKGLAYPDLLVDTINYVGGKVDKDRDIDAMETEVIRRQLEILWDSNVSSVKSNIANILGTPAKWSAVEDALHDPCRQLAAAEFLCSSDYDSDVIHEGAQRDGHGLKSKVGAFGGGFRRVLDTGMGEKVSGKLASVVSSHRVTLPCINHLTRIRLQVHKPAEVLSGEDLAPEAQSNVVQFPIGGRSCDVQDETGRTVLSMAEVELTSVPSTATRLDARKSGVNRWAPLLQAAPTAAVANEVASQRYMKVVVNGPLTMAKDGNGFRGFVQGQGGQTREHARLFEGDLSQVVNAAALFNVASFAVGQKHLADISRHLEEIQEGVDRIAKFQQRARESEIRGAIRYLQQVGPLIMDGEHTPVQFQKLEDCEAELLKIQEHLATDISFLVKEAHEAEGAGTFSVSSLRDRLAGFHQTFEELAHQWKLCLMTRMVACRLLCNFEGTARTVETREAAIRQDLAWLVGGEGVINSFSIAVNDRASKFKSLIESKVELQAHREVLKVMQEASLPALEQAATDLVANFDQLLQVNREPVELLVAVENGQVREVAVL